MFRSKIKVKEAKPDYGCDEHDVKVIRNFLKAKLFSRISIIISSMDCDKLLNNSNLNELKFWIQNKILPFFHN